jgi:8-oxo-dGTP pyrophosphatase MutT (NUDIX family)
MQTKILSIGIIKNGDTVLLRKKSDGSPPYKETWYLFGGEVNVTTPDPDKALVAIVKNQAGIDISVTEHIGWDTEIKDDHDGEEKLFIYLDNLCEYVGGELRWGEEIEKLEWVPIEKLTTYDLVPPSVKLFKKLGYL